MKARRTNHKFSPDEDQRLRELVKQFGEKDWDEIAANMKGRNERQCHDRWTYYLSPNINNSPWTKEEDDLLLDLSKKLNYKWVKISKHFKGRNDTQIKNRWNTLKKKLNLPDIIRRKPSESDTTDTSKNSEQSEKDEEQQSIIDLNLIFSKIDSVFASIDKDLNGYNNEFFI